MLPEIQQQSTYWEEQWGKKLIKQGENDIIASLYPDLGSLNLSALER